MNDSIALTLKYVRRILVDRRRERQMMKLPRQFESVFADNKPLDESIGRALAEWAGGKTGNEDFPDESAQLVEWWDATLARAAECGSDMLRDTWDTVPRELKTSLKGALERRHKVAALAFDARELVKKQ